MFFLMCFLNRQNRTIHLLDNRIFELRTELAAQRSIGNEPAINDLYNLCGDYNMQMDHLYEIVEESIAKAIEESDDIEL